MRHHLVTRIVISLAVLWTAAIVVFAWGVTRPAAPVSEPPPTAGPSGEALFARHCAMCHGDAAGIGASYRAMTDRTAAAAEFRAFLVDHYGPSPEGSAAIVEFVMEQ